MKYSKKEKERAIQQYKKLGNITKAVRRLGYPSRHMLYDWIDAYESTGTFTDYRWLNNRKKPKARQLLWLFVYPHRK